ncbi:MAG TPA: DUF805 domain-containing protein [Methylomirabilota bacterium]|nr:DUF805 domain-containing protein [Methylomirabilota bacterium]
MPFLAAVFGFRGRAPRAVYWFATICCGLGFFAFLAVGLDVPEDFILPVLAAAFLLLGWPALAIIVRRLHDRGKSAWWLLPYVALPIGLDVVTDYTEAGEIPARIGDLLILIATFELGVIPGTPGPNRYGPDPLRDPYAAPPPAP